ncbi:hypothetical protein IFM89_031682 [Coptis chinensis]|uniref:D-isomer specific 2-hydroxyacid dehydrogenase NAD-binding domain-containing protein n=1 Tax=Coptis chinensis TaxID=261450 RepID=A0A835HQY4_9MAGN|nr:hypothetical protein IFM89_031682 [Coptis chinensis]
MEEEQELKDHREERELQIVLLLGLTPPPLFKFFPELLQKFKFLSPFEYPTTPIHQFLKFHAQSIKVMICMGGRNEATCELGDAADFAVGLLLDVLRRISASNRYVRSGLWPLKGEYPLGLKVGGQRVGIVGLGSIGSEVAKRLDAFGCSISYNSRRKKVSILFPYYSHVCDLAANCDILILCCALTDETYHIINKDVLSALGKDGVIINVGRGALVDEKALVRFLVRGEIGGAGLDVFENEPTVPKEFLELDNVVLTLHKAVHTLSSLSALYELTMANLEAFFSNKPLLSPVNYEQEAVTL